MNLGSDERDVDVTTRHPDGAYARDARSLEDVLGPSAGRYFGHGYRGVRYEVRLPAGVGENPSQISAVGRAIYPPRWSVDSDGKPRLPHLSTIDATVLPLLFFEAAGLREPHRLSRRRVREVELRAAGTPWLELDVIPLTMSVHQEDAGETLVSTVGNIRSRIVLADEKQPVARQLVETVPRHSPTVYGGMFQAGGCRSMVWPSDAGASVLHGHHEFSVVGLAERPAPGIESDFWPSPTVVDYLVTMGQLTQALIYTRGETNRSSMGTLWMRTMTLTVDELSAPSPTVFTTTTRFVRDRILSRDGRRIHDIVVESSATTGARVNASLAYEETGEG